MVNIYLNIHLQRGNQCVIFTLMNNYDPTKAKPKRPFSSVDDPTKILRTNSTIHSPQYAGTGQAPLNLMQKKHRLSPMLVGEIVKRRRASLGLNQRALSEISQVAIHTLSNIEAGKGNPTVETLNRVLNVLGMEVHIGFKE